MPAPCPATSGHAARGAPPAGGPRRRRSAMRARAMAVFVALGLLAGTTAGVAAADQGGRLADSPAARVASAPAGLDSLLPADQLAPRGPAQWYQPWLTGGAGSNYLGPGGWRSYTPIYSPFG